MISALYLFLNRSKLKVFPYDLRLLRFIDFRTEKEMSAALIVIIFVIFLRIWLVKIATSSKARLVKFICLVHLAQPVLFYPTDMAFLRRMLHPVFAPLLHDLFQNNRWR